MRWQHDNYFQDSPEATSGARVGRELQLGLGEVDSTLYLAVISRISPGFWIAGCIDRKGCRLLVVRRLTRMARRIACTAWIPGSNRGRKRLTPPW